MLNCEWYELILIVFEWFKCVLVVVDVFDLKVVFCFMFLVL